MARAAQQLYAVTGRYDIVETGLLQIAACLFSRTFYSVLLVNYSNNHTPSTQKLLSAAITLFLIQQCTILNKLTPSTHTHPFNGPLSRTTQVSRYQKGKTNLDFTEARDSEWQWHQLGHMQVCTLLQTDNHASTPPLSFCRPGALPATQSTASKHWRHLAYLLCKSHVTNVSCKLWLNWFSRQLAVLKL